MAKDVSVHLEQSATPDEVEDVLAAFAAAGIEADVDATAYGIGNGAVWVVAVMVGFALRDFFAGFFGEGGAMAMRACKKWAEDVQAARERARGYQGLIDVKDTEGKGIHIAPAELPDDAYEQLFEIDWSEYESGVLMWSEGRWRWYETND